MIYLLVPWCCGTDAKGQSCSYLSPTATGCLRQHLAEEQGQRTTSEEKVKTET